MLWYDQPRWLLETRNTPGAGGGAWTDQTDKMLRLKTKRGVRSWWGGTIPGIAAFTLEQHDAEMGVVVGAEIKLSVSVPSGVIPVFHGRVQRITEQLQGNRFATYTISCTDAFGVIAQATTAAATGQPNALASDELRTLLAQFSTNGTPLSLAGITAAQGYSGDTNYSVSNTMDLVNQVVRGSLGILWMDTVQVAQFRNVNWWWPIPATTVAALGPVADTPGKTATYRIDYALSQPSGNIIDIKNDVTWNGPFPAGTYNQNAGSLGSTVHGIRAYTDTVRLVVDNDVIGAVDGLQAALGYTSVALPISAKTVKFPADLSEDASEYAAAADVTDYVEVAKASLVQSWSSWSHYHWVMTVQHEWSAAVGWFCTLGLADNVPDSEIEFGN